MGRHYVFKIATYTDLETKEFVKEEARKEGISESELLRRIIFDWRKDLQAIDSLANYLESKIHPYPRVTTR